MERSEPSFDITDLKTKINDHYRTSDEIDMIEPLINDIVDSKIKITKKVDGSV